MTVDLNAVRREALVPTVSERRKSTRPLAWLMALVVLWTGYIFAFQREVAVMFTASQQAVTLCGDRVYMNVVPSLGEASLRRRLIDRSACRQIHVTVSARPSSRLWRVLICEPQLACLRRESLRERLFILSELPRTWNGVQVGAVILLRPLVWDLGKWWQGLRQSACVSGTVQTGGQP